MGSAHLSLQAVLDETDPVIKIGQHIHCNILALFPKKLTTMIHVVLTG